MKQVFIKIEHNLTNKKMKNLKKQYKTTKLNAIEYMKNGQISAYFNALLEMNKYKALLTAVSSN